MLTSLRGLFQGLLTLPPPSLPPFLVFLTVLPQTFIDSAGSVLDAQSAMSADTPLNRKLLMAAGPSVPRMAPDP